MLKDFTSALRPAPSALLPNYTPTLTPPVPLLNIIIGSFSSDETDCLGIWKSGGCKGPDLRRWPA